MGYYFRGFLILLLLLFLLHGSMLAQEQHYNSFLELLSRDEAVQMAGYGEQKLSTVLITGSVYCHTPFHHPHEPSPVPGALVGVKCHSYGSVARGVTDEFGDFIVDIPSHLHAIPNLEKVCSVQLHSIPKGSMCQPFQVVTHNKGLTLSSFGNGIRTYTAGNIRINHSPTT